MEKAEGKTFSAAQDGVVLINGYAVHPDASFNIAEAAAILGRSQVTVYRMVKAGSLCPVFQASGRGKLTVWGRAIINASKLQQVEGDRRGDDATV